MAKVKVVKVRRGERLAKQIKRYYSEYLIDAAAAPRMAERLFPKLEWHTYQPLQQVTHGERRADDAD